MHCCCREEYALPEQKNLDQCLGCLFEQHRNGAFLKGQILTISNIPVGHAVGNLGANTMSRAVDIFKSLYPIETG